MMELSCVEDFARLPGEADFAAVERLEADAGRLIALGIDMGDVRDVKHGFLLDDAAGLAHGGGGGARPPVCGPRAGPPGPWEDGPSGPPPVPVRSRSQVRPLSH